MNRNWETLERLERAVHKHSGGPDAELTQLLEEARCALKQVMRELLIAKEDSENYRRQTDQGQAWDRAHGKPWQP